MVTRGLDMLVSAVPCNVDAGAEDERAAQPGEWAHGLTPRQRPHGDRDEGLRERQDRSSRAPDPRQPDDEYDAGAGADRRGSQGEEPEVAERDRVQVEEDQGPRDD